MFRLPSFKQAGMRLNARELVCFARTSQREDKHGTLFPTTSPTPAHVSFYCCLPMLFLFPHPHFPSPFPPLSLALFPQTFFPRWSLPQLTLPSRPLVRDPLQPLPPTSIMNHDHSTPPIPRCPVTQVCLPAPTLFHDMLSALIPLCPAGWLLKRGVVNTGYKRRWFVLKVSRDANVALSH